MVMPVLYLLAFGTSFPKVVPGSPIPDSDWKIQAFQVPRSDASAHQDIREYKLSLDTDRWLKIEANVKKTGSYEAGIRKQHVPLPPQEREDMGRDDWRDRLASAYEILDYKLTNVDNFNVIIDETVFAKRKLDSDTEVIVLNPFPGDELPLTSPSFWPRDRTQPMVLPTTFTRVDLARIEVPDGFKLRGDPTWAKVCSVGNIRFQVLQKGNTIIGRREIVLIANLVPADLESDVRNFLAWMKETYLQTIGISEKG